jgi:hypothetical protein
MGHSVSKLLGGSIGWKNFLGFRNASRPCGIWWRIHSFTWTNIVAMVNFAQTARDNGTTNVIARKGAN